jgi:hypothetical protein
VRRTERRIARNQVVVRRPLTAGTAAARTGLTSLAATPAGTAERCGDAAFATEPCLGRARRTSSVRDATRRVACSTALVAAHACVRVRRSRASVGTGGPTIARAATVARYGARTWLIRRSAVARGEEHEARDPERP